MRNHNKYNKVEVESVSAQKGRTLFNALLGHGSFSFLNPRSMLGIIVQNKFINTAFTFFILTLLVLSPVGFSFAAEQESLSPVSKPIEGRKPEYETGQVQPSLDGNLPLPNNSTFTEENKFGDLNVILETPSASDQDDDESPNLRLELSTDNLTNIPKPLMQWFLLDKNDPVNGPKTSISIQETLNSVRIVDVAPGRKVELQINASLIPFTLTGFPRDGDSTPQEKHYQFIVPPRTPSVMSDNFYNPINSHFPTIGFKNGSFNIITPLLAKDYNWEVDATSRDLVVVDGSKSFGVVKLIKQPDINPSEYHPITITATPKEGVTPENPIISHTFTLTRWLIYGPEVLAGRSMPVEYDIGLAACKTLGEIYGIPRASYFVQFSNDGTQHSRSLTGNLWNEWGDISKASQEPWVLTGKTGLEGYYHSFDQTAEGSKVTAHLGNGLSKEVLFTESLNLACAVNLDGSPLDTPQLRNFVLSGELLSGNTPIVSYSFDPATSFEDDPTSIDNSRYSWGIKGKTTTGAGNLKTLVIAGTDIIAEGAVDGVKATELEGSGITEFKLPALTNNEIGKVLEISIQPINIDNVSGPIQTISTDQPGSAGNQTYTRYMRVDGSKTQVFEVDNSGVLTQNIKFPSTGFKGAFFTLGLETGLTSRDFDWQVQQGTDLVTVNKDGVVELLKMPADNKKEIIITGTSKPTIYKPVLTYDNKRVSGQPITYTYKFTLQQWYLGNTGGTPLTRDQADSLCYAANKEFDVDNFAIPSFKYQLFEAATADNNKNTSFIKFNGMLLNEWGDLRAFANSDFKSEYYWVAEIGDANNRKLNKRVSWDATNVQATAANTNDQSGDLFARTQLMCGRNLDGSDFYGIPKLKDFRLSGAIAEGSKLTISYYFVANNLGAPLNGTAINATNLTTIDLSTYASSYQGQNTAAAALVTNDKISVKLTPVTVIYDPIVGMYRAEYLLGPLPAGSQDNIIAISVRPIIQGDLSGMIRTIDSKMTQEDGNYTYRGFASVATITNPYTFYGRELESNSNFPTTGFKGAKFRLNSSANASENTNPLYNWNIHFDALEAANGTDASEYFQIGQTGTEAGNVTMLKRPPFNRRVYVTATNKTNPVDKLAYGFKLQKWYDPNLNNFDAFYSVSTPLNTAEFLPNQPSDPLASNADFSNVFPTTGFPGAKFKLNIGVSGALNNQFNWWTSEDEKPFDDRSVKVNNLGEVVLLSRPEFNSTITVYAQFKDLSRPPLQYTFKLQKWFDPMLGSEFYSIQTPLVAYEFLPVGQPTKKNPDDFTGVFPSTGFPGALFRINLGGTNGRDNLLYTWSSSHPELASVGNGTIDSTPNGAGNVVLLKDPEVATEIIISARPKPEVNQSTRVLNYRFKVTKWFNQNLPAINVDFYSAETFLSDAEYPVIQPKDKSTNPNADFSKTFPTTGFPGAILRLNIGMKGGRDNTLYTWVSSHPDLVSVGNNGIVGTTPQNAGNVSLLKDPDIATPVTITATPIGGMSENTKVLTYTFKVTKWFHPDLPLNGSSSFYSAETFLNDYEYLITQPKDAPSPDADYSNTFPTTGFLGAIFRLNIGAKGGLFNTDYNWSTSEDSKPESQRLIKVGNSGTVNSTDTGSGNVTLLSDPDVATPVTVVAVPKGGATSINPELRYTFKITKWFHPNLSPQLANSNFYSVGTFLTNYEHPVVQPEDVNASDADFSKTFPTTGFPGAVFRLNIGDGNGRDNALYNWTLVNPAYAEYVKLGNNGVVGTGADNAGNVTLINDPEHATVITVIATPIPEKTSDTRVMRYSFKMVKWFNQDLKPFEFFASITVSDGQKLPIGESKGGDYSKVFPQTGFKNAKFRLNVDDDTAAKNSAYNWRSSDPTVASVNANGEVTLLKRPTTSGLITITAEPKDTSSGDAPLSYTFKLTKWFDVNLAPPAGRFSVITLPLDEDTIQLPINTPAGSDFSKVFPQTGFTNSMFRLNIGNTTAVPSKNDSYNWSVTASEAGIVKLGNTVNLDKRNVESAGNITLLKRPSAPVIVTITATNKTNVTDKLTYQFKLAKWFEINLEDYVTHFASLTTIYDQATLAVVEPDGGDFSGVFPRTGFKGAMFRLNIANPDNPGQILNTEYNWRVEGDTNADLVSVGNAAVSNVATGAGNVTLLKRPASPTEITIVATPKVANPFRKELRYAFKLEKWFETQLNANYTRQFHSISLPHGNSADDVTGTPMKTLPIIVAKDFDFSGVFPRTGFTNAAFRLNIGTPEALLNDQYTWSLIEDGTTGIASVGNISTGTSVNKATAGVVTLIRRPDAPTVVTVKATPKSGVGSELTYQFRVAKWFAANLLKPVERIEWISLKYGNSSGPLVIGEPRLLGVTEPVEGDFSNVFPRTGFKNAQFRLSIDRAGQLNTSYTWNVNKPDLVKVGTSPVLNDTADSAGNVTLLKKPDQPTEIVITAKPPVITSSTPVLTYRFKLEKWFEVNLDKPLLRFNSATSPFDGELELEPIALIKPSAGDFTKTYPRTGFDGAMFRLNIGDPTAPLNNQYIWSTSEDAKPSIERLVSVGNGLLDTTANGAGNVRLLKRPVTPTEITVTARVKPEFIGSRPELRPELTYTFKTERWFSSNMAPQRITKAFSSITAGGATTNIGSTELSNAINDNFEKVFPVFGGTNLAFMLNINGFNATDFDWTSSEPDLATVNVNGVVTLQQEPEKQTIVMITAKPQNSSDKSVYVYRFRASKWTRFSPTNMLGYYQAAPNSRWPEDIWEGAVTEWPWPVSNGGSENTELSTTNPDLYCESLGNGYRTMSGAEYSANYPIARPFTLSTSVAQNRLRTGSYSHEWGSAMQQSIGSNTALWLAEPMSANIRLSTRANTQVIQNNAIIGSALNKAACVRELPVN